MRPTRFRTIAALGLHLGLLGLLLALPSVSLRADGKPVPRDPGIAPANPSGDVFGYSAAFDAELKKIGQISPREFARLFPSGARYLGKLSFDPTKARFFDDLNAEPGRSKKAGYDFRLNGEERAAFKKNGFVVSERMGAASFSEQFYRVFSRDLPVFISSDALLHAWHRSYDAMLEELEETYLATSLDEILAGMTSQLPAARKAHGSGILSESIEDADYFLAVARSLLAGQPVKTHLGQDAKVVATLRACDNLQLQEFKLFGRDRKVDFSQFKVRGHYENSELLRRYFRAMMWCGRIDLRVAGGSDEHRTASSPRELGAAIVLHDLLKRAGKFDQWAQFDRMIQTFVGRTDSMTFAQLGDVLATGGINSPADVKGIETLKKLQDEILAGKIGLQHIRSHYVVSSPFGPDKADLSRSFTLMGQKFVVDSWVTAKVVADEIFWDGRKVQRRVPSCLDVAFAAFGNDQVVPELVARMTDSGGRQFRDGLNYQHNLAAVRRVIDAQNRAVWDENLYMNWLATLRTLSRPTTDDRLPEVVRTRAWAMKSLNTQFASWAQLRHDTILYVKQSYTAKASCYYPAGYVEPVVPFWARLEKMASRAADLVEKTEYPDRVIEKPVFYQGKKINAIRINLKDTQKKQAAFLRNFARQVGLIRSVCEKQLAQRELTAEEKKVLQDVVQIQHGSGFTRYNGWYPKLFYKGTPDSGKWDAIVADVHTDVPAPALGDPGCVLTQGVGNVDLLVVAIDNGKDRVVYAGPVLSHYEFEMPGVTRKSDSEWRKDIIEGKLPPRPSWTRSYLVPGKNPQAPLYRYKAN
jgi:Protein of unknown function (DUF3160)